MTVDPVELPARWTIWNESAPAGHSPSTDATGADCGLRQPPDVWFLSGTRGGSATRTCQVPSGRSIYFPVVARICTISGGRTVAEAKRVCQSPTVNVAKATLDGKSQPVRRDISNTPYLFTTKDAETGFTLGTHAAVTWGMWVGPVRLRDGKHTLSFRGSAPAFTTQVTYHLVVG